VSGERLGGIETIRENYFRDDPAGRARLNFIRNFAALP
jgi:hypothetical protein